MSGTNQNSAGAATPVWIAPAPDTQVRNITTEDGTLAKTGPGIFLGLSVNTAGSASNAEIVDGVDGAGVVLGTIDTTKVGPVTPPAGGWPFAVGLFVITQGSAPADITVSFL